jgi:DNA-binding transcriptional regulator of glucitol operon
MERFVTYFQLLIAMNAIYWDADMFTRWWQWKATNTPLERVGNE